MRIQSPLSNLCDVLDQLKASASQYQSTLKKNEAATRAVLVDPVLQALGWDTANTFMVEVEKTLNKTRVDYALFDSNGDVKVIVEAKKLGEDLGHRDVFMNLVIYAFEYRLQDIFLTDGVKWHHFTNFQPGNATPPKIINLADDDPVESAAYLVHRLDAAKFWPERLGIDVLTQQVAQLESIVSSLQQEMIHLRKSETAAQQSGIAKSGTAETVRASAAVLSTVPLVDLRDVPAFARSKPVAFRLPDGSEVPVRKWKDVLVLACKFTLARQPNLTVPLHDHANRKVNLLALTKPPTGISYVEEQYGSQMIYIYTNYSAIGCIVNAAYILEKVPAADVTYRPALAFADSAQRD